MTFSSLVYSSAILPLSEKHRYAGLRDNLRRGAKEEKRSLPENLQSQWLSLISTLQNAYNNVPFYRKRFDAIRLKISDIRQPSDLVNIPILTRDDVRNNFEDLWSRAFSRNSLLEAATGGTTDTPVKILRDPVSIRLRTAMQMQFNSWARLLPGDKVFWLWGARSDYAENPSWRWKMFDRYVMRRVWAPTSLLNEKILAGYAAQLDRFRPKAIMAYPTPLTAFCEFLLTTGYRGSLPTTAICTAEPLLASQRVIIEKALGCSVFVHYGTRDFGLVAAECEHHRGLHVNTTAVFTETIAIQNSPEGLQELIVTDLVNRGFPLIRYKINDCVFPQDPQCPCGRGFPLISYIEGRVADNFYLPNGDLVPGIAFTNRIIKTSSGIKKLQVIQKKLDLFTINYVPDAEFMSSDLDVLQRKLIEFLGTGINFKFMKVDDIEREGSGKTRLCISKLSPADFPIVPSCSLGRSKEN